MKHAILIALPVLALAACGQDADTPDNDLATPSEVVLPADESPTGDADPSSGNDMAESDDSIPGALRGRWGMNANDCDPAQADAAKGLIDVSDTSITFYESRAELASIAERSDTRIRATFDMTGEGMEWTRDMTLDVQDDGQTMIRREYGDDAMSGPLKYQRCTA